MFEYLSNSSADQAIASAYYAIRLLKHYRQIKSVEEGYLVRGLETEPSAEDAKFAGKIISEIEAVENSPIQEIGEQKVASYVSTLAGIVQNMVKQRLNYDEQRGEVLLEALKDSSSKLM